MAGVLGFLVGFNKNQHGAVACTMAHNTPAPMVHATLDLTAALSHAVVRYSVACRRFAFQSSYEYRVNRLWAARLLAVKYARVLSTDCFTSFDRTAFSHISALRGGWHEKFEVMVSYHWAVWCYKLIMWARSAGSERAMSGHLD